VSLLAGALPELGLRSLVERLRPGSRLVLLDGVEDPQNLGAIARVADAAGVSGIVLTTRHAPPLSPTVSRTSAGAIEWLPVARVANLIRAIEDLKRAGFWVVGADPEAAPELYDLPDPLFRGHLALVLGAEGRGLRPGVLKQLDHPVRIPMRGRVGSLNVAAAAAAVLYEVLRRTPTGSDLGPSVARDESRAVSERES
jgi:23S rRNA (guanosine2251-2'-O)-methyltransferase